MWPGQGIPTFKGCIVLTINILWVVSITCNAQPVAPAVLLHAECSCCSMLACLCLRIENHTLQLRVAVFVLLLLDITGVLWAAPQLVTCSSNRTTHLHTAPSGPLTAQPL